MRYIKSLKSVNPNSEANPMFQVGLFDCQTRFEQLTDAGDPLVRLNDVIDWELFRPEPQRIRDKERKSNAGRLLVRTIGIVRARTKIGLRNLAYNIDRYGTLALTQA